ncbi:MAG TPA: type II toxin-antitoxin system RelE/ParE family toxin [Rhodanobacteraceae bacterium]|nr:type II toxin-antitoxin system RelE/ParE family toxin [Rhodanobacteraceae bacterium]
MRLEWSLSAIEDREAIFEYIGQDNPQAAIDIDERITLVWKVCCSFQ